MADHSVWHANVARTEAELAQKVLGYEAPAATQQVPAAPKAPAKQTAPSLVVPTPEQ